MNETDFLRPRLSGARYAGHSIPLEVLKDLAVLEEMIIEVAKMEFLKDHPGRKRSPRRFTEGIELKLVGIEDGSAVPVIALDISVPSLFPPGIAPYLERGRDAIISAISAAEHNGPITDHLPEKTLGYFDRLGRSLRDGEAIEFGLAGAKAPVRLTKETRRTLLLASSQIKELSEEMQVRGSVPEADQDDMSFELQLTDGRKVKAPLAPQHLEAILDAFNGYKSGARVLLQGVGRVNRGGKLVGFESVEHVTLLDPLDVLSRLDELRQLKDGWLEGRGCAPAPSGIDWLCEVFSRNYPDDLPQPFVYPTEEGGIRMEWELAPWDASLDIDLARHQGHWHALRTDTAEETERRVDLDQPDQWQWLAQRLQDRMGASA